MERRGMKNPDNTRMVSAAITLWILRFAQNDNYRRSPHE